jgi:hypothetical protein
VRTALNVDANSIRIVQRFGNQIDNERDRFTAAQASAVQCVERRLRYDSPLTAIGNP